MHNYFLPRSALIACLFVFAIMSANFNVMAGATTSTRILLDAHEDILLRLMNAKTSRTLDEPGANGQANFANWKAGGVNAVFFAVWLDPDHYPGIQAVDQVNRIIDCFEKQVKLYPDKLVACDTAAEVSAAVSQGKLAGLLGIEGGVAINDDLSNIEKFRKRGVRYMTLTWHGNLRWAGSSQPDTAPHDVDSTHTRKGIPLDERSSGGLTDFGRKVIYEMNRVGMVVDLSHVSDQTFYDAISVSSRPVMVSHSNARALSNHPRNVTDDMLRTLAKNNGVIGLNLWYELLEPSGLGSKKPGATSVTLEMVLDQLDHMIKIGGIDHVGIGTDFEGMSDLPPELDSAAGLSKIIEGMKRRGYSDGDIDKVAGLNFLRVLQANEDPR